MAPLDSEQVERVARALANASSVLFITGAGISADSGLPTYRGIGGLYNGRTTADDMPIEVALSGPMFRQRPELTWKHIAEIEAACRGAAPNRGHEVIAELSQRIPRAWVLTQNVDGLHRAAGSDNVIDIHGDVHVLFCPHCSDYRERVVDYSALDLPPRCPGCGEIVRPDVVLFGEYLHPERAQKMNQELSKGFDVVISIGTTSVFPYIAAPFIAGHRNGDLTIEINPGDSEVSDFARELFRSGAAATLSAIFDAYERLAQRG